MKDSYPRNPNYITSNAKRARTKPVEDQLYLKTIGVRMRIYREVHGLSQVQMAEKIGTNTRTYTSVEYGETDFGITLARRICEKLNIPIQEIFATHGQPTEIIRTETHAVDWREVEKRISRYAGRGESGQTGSG